MNLQQVPWIKLLLTLLVMAALLWLYLTKMEWVERTETKSYSKAARENPLLASTLLVKSFGYPSEKMNSVLPHALNAIDTDEVIWVLQADAISEGSTLEELAQWTKNGGHLMLGILPPVTPQLKTALSNFSVSVTDDTLAEKSSVVTLRPNNAIDAITIEFFAGADISTASDYIQGIKQIAENDKEERAFVVLQKTYGKGVLTVLSDAGMFNNRRLKEYDNGALLLHLLASHPGKNINYFIEERFTPGLLETLWRNFPITVIGLCVSLAASVFYAGARLGPIREEQAPGRTNLISHLRARGHFWRRRRQLAPLTNPVKHAALRKIRQNYRIPSNSIEALPNHVIKDIAESTGASERNVKRVLSDAILSEVELPNAAILLKKILSNPSSSSQHTTRLSP